MKIILNNNVELNPLLVIGGKRQIQGATRDTLSFVFPVDTSLDELDALFSAENCESITLIEDETCDAYIHIGYTIRAELKRAPIVITPATESDEEVIENRVTVSMSQRTYAETQLASLTETVDLLVMESLMAE